MKKDKNDIEFPNLRIYCIFSREALTAMGGNRGKMVAQGGHAFLHSFWDCSERFPELASQYKQYMTRKITLVVETNAELEKLVEDHRSKTGVTLVKDAGLTVFKEPTVTCAGIGPIDLDNVSDQLKSLKVLI